MNPHGTPGTQQRTKTWFTPRACAATGGHLPGPQHLCQLCGQPTNEENTSR